MAAVAPIADRTILHPSISLDTPTMVVDESLMHRNISEMQALANSFGVNMRPHIKTHKTPQIALLQIAAGAIGITCAKLGEAEVMAEAGVDDILIAYPIVGPEKMKRLVPLLDKARVIVALDSVEAGHMLSDAVSSAERLLDVYVEVDTGQHRAGALAGKDAVRLGLELARMPGLNVIGIMSHEGHTHSVSAAEIEAAARNAGERLVETAERLRLEGVDIREVSVGSTPSSHFTPSVMGITEMRPGTYVFRDTTGFLYGRYGPDRCAARILATVVSHPAPNRMIVDAGSKTLALDLSHGHPGHGYIVGHPTSIIERLSEEHGVVAIGPDDTSFHIGDRVEIIPNHVCPSLNLLDELHIARDGEIIDVWPIAARGKVR